jgi:hypothetical protein
VQFLIGKDIELQILRPNTKTYTLTNKNKLLQKLLNRQCRILFDDAVTLKNMTLVVTTLSITIKMLHSVKQPVA